MLGIDFRRARRAMLWIPACVYLLLGAAAAPPETEPPAEDSAAIAGSQDDGAAPTAGAEPTAEQGGPEAQAEIAPGATIDQVLGDEDPAISAIRAQIAAQEFDESIAWLNQHVELVERVSHRYDAELIEPLTLLGDAHAGKGEYDTALDHYQRATHLSRVNHGLNSAHHVPIVYREADAFKALRNYEAANDREEYAYHVLTRAHGAYDAELLPGVYHLAAWYSRTNNVFSARAMYQHALNILSATGQENSELALPAYRGIAASYRLERFPPFYISSSSDSSAMRSQFEPEYADTVSVNNFPAGERALQQIIAIYRESPDKYSPEVQTEAILDLADWYLLWDKYSRAYPLYAHAYAMVEEIDGVEAGSVFGTPKLLHFPAPQRPKAPPPHLRGPEQQGVVEVAFSVTKNGHVRGLSTILSEPEGMMDFRVRKSLRQARYRPVLVDGVPGAHPEHRYQYTFAYFPKVEPEPDQAMESGDAE